MRILVIVSSIGKSAAGIVAEEILFNLINQNPETYIICNQKFSDRIPKENVSELQFTSIRYTKIDKSLLVITHKDWNSRSWVKKGLYEFKKIYDIFNPDVVLSFVSAYDFHVLEIGFIISKYINRPFAIHSFDSIPSPPGWGENNYLRKAIISIIKPYYEHAKFISATNETMLQYQIEILKLSVNKKICAVIYNPAKIPNTSLGPPLETNSFIYLGTLYEKRNPQLIIDIFYDYYKENRPSKFYFIGDNRCTDIKIPEEIKENVIFHNWTDNPEEFIARINTLVDIDSNIPGDVFMSSKLSQYLMYNRPILCITHHNSPAENFTKSLTQTVFCTCHIKKEILNGMRRANMVVHNDEIYKERTEVRQKLKGQNICIQLLKGLESII